MDRSASANGSTDAPHGGGANPHDATSGAPTTSEGSPTSSHDADAEGEAEKTSNPLVRDGAGTADLVQAIDGLCRQTERFHERADSYESTIRQMQARLEDLQGDQVKSLLKPIIQRLAALHAQAAEAEERAVDRSEKAEKDFGYFAIAIEETLALFDVESVGARPGVDFDPSRHHAIRRVPTTDRSHDRVIQRVIRQGFTYAGAPRTLLPAKVSIYAYKEAEALSDLPTDSRAGASAVDHACVAQNDKEKDDE